MRLLLFMPQSRLTFVFNSMSEVAVALGRRNRDRFIYFLEAELHVILRSQGGLLFQRESSAGRNHGFVPSAVP